jgi:hypothetical protein
VPFGDSVRMVCPPILLTPAVQQGSFGERAALGSLCEAGRFFLGGESGQPCFLVPSVHNIFDTIVSSELCTINAERICPEIAARADPASSG